MRAASPFFSVIICSIDPWKFAQTCACYQRLFVGLPHEIIGIHDAHSLAEGYNRGLKNAQGDIVLFSHDDVSFLDRQFAQKIAERMCAWDVLGFAGASRVVTSAWFGANWPHLHGAVCHWSQRMPNFLSLVIYGAPDWPVVGDIEVLDGLCIIARHEVAAAIGFDGDTFDGWHLYDCDFSFAAHLAGYKLGVCCDIPYIHASGSVQSGKSTFDSDDYLKYAERFISKYKERMLPITLQSAHAAVCYLSDHHILAQFWTEETFRRTTVALARRHKHAIETASA